MDFRSIYQHGFARVAACTGRVAIADPPANAEMVLRQARACAEEGVAVALFPELTLTGYSIEDLLLQDAVLDGAESRARHGGRGLGRTCCRCSSSAPRCATATASTTARSSSTAAACSASCRSPTRRPTASSTRAGRSPRASASAARSALGGEDVPFGPDLLFAADDVPGLVVHAEICEDMWIPVPPSAEAALAGATVLLNLSGSPITVGRAEDRKLLCRSASSRCLAAYVYAAAGQGESTTDLSWDGQTTIYENGVLLAETERFPDGDRRAVADVDLDLLLQERRRMGTFDDNRRAHAERTGAFRRIALHARPARRRPRAARARSSASRSCPPTSTGSTSTATRPTTSRSPASSSGCGRSATRRSSSASPAGSTRRRR